MRPDPRRATPNLIELPLRLPLPLTLPLTLPLALPLTQGVCLGLSELMSAAGRETCSDFLPQLIAAVRTGLCDAEQAP